MNETPVDRRSTRIQVSAEENRKTGAAQVEQDARRSEIRSNEKRESIRIREEKKLSNERIRTDKRKKRRDEKNANREARRKARQDPVKRINESVPNLGRRAMICGPILAPMTVAWIGQIGFATGTLEWPFIGGLVFAAAWELTTAFCGWMYHEARKDGDRGLIFRIATWIFALSAGAMNYWHACPIVPEHWGAKGQIVPAHISLAPSPKAVSYGVMSLTGIALWELYSFLVHRKHLRAEGKIAEARPRFGLLRWVRYTRITWHAWSVTIRYGIKTVDEAWKLAVVEVARKKHEKATAAEKKRLTKDKRPEVRVTVTRVQTYKVPERKERMKLFWVEDLSALTVGPVNGSETGFVLGSHMGPNGGSQTRKAIGSGTQTQTRSETGPSNRSETQVPNNSGTQTRTQSETQTHHRSETSTENGSKTGPSKKRTRRSKTGPKTKVSDRLAEAIAADKAYFAEHGRRIPAEKLARALGIGKTAALDLVKQVRGGHIDVAK